MSDMIFNMQEALDRLDGDAELLQSLFDIFLADADTYIADVETAWADRDMVRLHRAAHTIKGVMGTFGATRAQDQALSLEHAAKAGDIAYCETLVPALVAELQILYEALPRG